MKNVDHIEPITMAATVVSLGAKILGSKSAKKKAAYKQKVSNQMNELSNFVQDKNNALSVNQEIKNKFNEVEESKKVNKLVFYMISSLCVMLIIYLIFK